MFQNGKMHFKYVAVNFVRFIKCVWLFWDIMHERVRFEQYYRSTYIFGKGQDVKYDFKYMFELASQSPFFNEL